MIFIDIACVLILLYLMFLRSGLITIMKNQRELEKQIKELKKLL